MSGIVGFGTLSGTDSVTGGTETSTDEAFIEALTDSFPNARARAMLTALMGKGRKVRDLLLDQAQDRIDRLDVEQAASTLSDSFANSPASSASIPAP